MKLQQHLQMYVTRPVPWWWKFVRQ